MYVYIYIYIHISAAKDERGRARLIDFGRPGPELATLHPRLPSSDLDVSKHAAKTLPTFEPLEAVPNSLVRNFSPRSGFIQSCCDLHVSIPSRRVWLQRLLTEAAPPFSPDNPLRARLASVNNNSTSGVAACQDLATPSKSSAYLFRAER